MGRFSPRRFSDPDWLRSIAPARLNAFLTPWAEYLGARGCALPTCGSSEISYETLSNVLMTPDASTPADMVDALYLVRETATPEDMDALVVAAQARGVPIDPDPSATPADLAIEIWVRDQPLLRERHAEALAWRQQTFDYYGSRDARGRNLSTITASALRAIEAELDDWFEKHRRGRGTRVMVFRRERLIWLVVRHGKTMRRDASHGEDGRGGTTLYRPQRHDVLIYDEGTGELGVSAETLRERKLYLRTLGAHLFGDADHFPSSPRFTLQPLVELGADSLAWSDVAGIEGAWLTEYRLVWGGTYKEVEIRRASDIFAAMRARGLHAAVPRAPAAATFKVKFSGAPKVRSVTIKIPASARYERNEDGETFERWLAARGFLLRGAGHDERHDANAGTVLERT